MTWMLVIQCRLQRRSSEAEVDALELRLVGFPEELASGGEDRFEVVGHYREMRLVKIR